MAVQFNLDNDRKLSNGITQFVPLGNHKDLNEADISKIQGQLAFSKVEKPENLWGTLGWKDDTPFDEEGKLVFSKEGQDDFAEGQTLEQIEHLYDIYPEIPVKQTSVRERFIDLTDVHISPPKKLTKDNLNELRLELFLKRNEGAIVFIQHGDKNNYNDKDAFLEFVSAEPTSSDNNLTNRTALTFYIPFQIRNELRPNGKSLASSKKDAHIDYIEVTDKQPKILSDKDAIQDGITQIGFVIKVLTFFRNAQTPEQALKSIGSNVAKKTGNNIVKKQLDKFGQGKYSLRKYVANKSFSDPDKQIIDVSDGEGIDINAKTLIFIHGMFSSFEGSFEDLLSEKYNGSNHNFLNHLATKGRYKQILVFDHPTYWDTPEENAEWLFNGPFKGLTFKRDKVDIITTSRGSLVAMALATSPELAIRLKIRRVLFFSAGGCGFLTSIDGVAKLVSILKRTASGPIQKILLGILSIGLDYTVKNSGLAASIPGSDFLKRVYSAPLPHPVSFKPMVADWNKKLIRNERRWKEISLRILASGLDVIIMLFLGTENDWVIGCSEQRKVPAGNMADVREQHNYKCTHGKYFQSGFPLRANRREMGDWDVHDEILKYLR